MITTISFDADGTLWDFPSVMQEALSVTDLQQTRDEVARTLRGNKVSLEYIRLKAFEQTLSNLGHNDPELASHLTTFYLTSFGYFSLCTLCSWMSLTILSREWRVPTPTILGTRSLSMI